MRIEALGLTQKLFHFNLIPKTNTNTIQRTTLFFHHSLSPMAETPPSNTTPAPHPIQPDNPPKQIPPPPEKPDPDDCCGSGCVRCVWDMYYDKLDEYDKLYKDDSNNTKS